jgi:hypothetical protein
MCRGHTALIESERLYDDINMEDGPLNIDIEKHLRRSEVKAAQAKSGWRWPGSLAAKANDRAIQASDPTLSKGTCSTTG